MLTAILIALLFVALPNVFRNRGPVPTIDVSRGQSVFASRIWRPIGRKQVLDQTLYVGRTQFWNVTGEPSVSGFKTRYTLGGRWASNETLAFVVIDPEDVNRLHAGSPPLIAYERHDGSLQVPWPAVGSMYGFVRPQPTLQGVPTSVSSLALRIVEEAIMVNRPPVAVTFNLWVDGECNCTQAEAARLFQN